MQTTEDAKADFGARGAGVWEMADIVTPMAVRVAATLRIADHIASGTRTTPELARAVHADTDALDRVLWYLTRVGVLRRDESGAYALTPRGDELRDDHPRRMRARLDIEGAFGRADLCFVQLLHTVRTGEAAYPLQFGTSFWDDLSADPGRAAMFDRHMGSDVSAQAPAIAAALDWGALGHVVDVGGGDGSLLLALLRRYPGLRGTVVDLPGPVERARATLAAAGVADRTDVVAGSFFDPLPAGAGGYLLSAIVHNWDDGAARAILRRCAEAAGTGGSVFLVDRVGPDGESPRTEMDLGMLAWFGGKERGLAALTALGADAGLGVATTRVAGRVTIVELVAR